jgi:hypothetical protein
LRIIHLEHDVPLEIDRLYRQVADMASALPEAISRDLLADARAFFQRADPDLLRQKLRQRERGTAKIPWLVAEPIDTLRGTFAAPAPPEDLSVAAADGSSMPPDRHSSVRYYVLNIGYAILTYGRSPHASLESQGRFCFEQQDLYFDPLGKRIPIEGTRLGILMSIEELVGLWQAAQQATAPAVALCDGSLILWNLQSEDGDLQHHYLHRFLSTLDEFRRSGLPIASYISYPGGHDIANSMRLMLCDRPAGNCANCPQATREQVLCRFMGGLQDRHLLRGMLEPGERSDIFQSQSAILDRYREHRILFFYLNVGGEIARIEAPQWVIDRPEMLDLVHATVFDQCRRSGQYPPYPPVLIEAHEQAVISTADRQAVEGMIERVLALQGYDYVRSAKDRSKRSRGV